MASDDASWPVMSEVDQGATPPVKGRVIAVTGSVVDVSFAGCPLPAVNTALDVEWDGPHRLTLEVQQHLDLDTIRGVAMQNTAGLARGVSVLGTGGPITVPVGDAVLGRLLNVVGEPVDRLGDFAADVPRRSIHQPSPKLEQERSGARGVPERHQGHRPSGAASPMAARPRCSAAPGSARPC